MSEFQFAWDVRNELRRVLPQAGEMLGTTPRKVGGGLEVLDAYALPLRRSPDFYPYRDHLLYHCGVDGRESFVRTGSSHVWMRNSYVGFGLLLYRSAVGRVRYVVYRTVDKSNVAREFLIVRRGEAGKLYRACLRAENLALAEGEKRPVLAPGLLDGVVRNTVGFLKRARQIKRYGVRIKRGLLLHGEPGNGKTMLCRYVQRLCSAHRITWQVVTASDIEKAFAENDLAGLLHRYEVSFLDDIDISYLSRGSGGDPRKACALLAALDGMEGDTNAVRIFTTNESVEAFDAAFRRPGRIDFTYQLEKPDQLLRKQLVASWPAEMTDVLDADRLVRETEEFSFAELEAIRAALVTAKVVDETDWDLDRALDEVRGKRKEKRRLGLAA